MSWRILLPSIGAFVELPAGVQSFAAGLHIYGADVHPVQIDNFYCYAIGSFLKQDVGTSVVFVGVSVFVKTGGHFAYGAEYFLGVVKLLCEQVVVNVGAGGEEADIITFIEQQP